jgi:hypothetical protein
MGTYNLEETRVIESSTLPSGSVLLTHILSIAPLA